MKLIPSSYRSFRLLCSFLLCISVLKAAALECSRTVEDQSESPSFLCVVDITLIRKPGCELFITERFLFPHTTGKNASRDIPKLDDLQEVSDIKVYRDGSPMSVLKGDSDDNEIRIILPTETSREPVLYVISYALSNGVMRFTDTCGREGDEDSSKNVMRWRSGKWNLSFDRLQVNFTSTSEKGKLEPLFEEKPTSASTDKQVLFLKEDVDENVEIYVAESGEKPCAEETGCFPDGKGLGVFAIISIVFAALAVLAAICQTVACCILICTNKCGIVTEVCSEEVIECFQEFAELLNICGACLGGGGDGHGGGAS